MFWWYQSIERPGDQTISRVSNQSPDTSLILLLRPLPSRVATPSNPRQWLHMHLENIHVNLSMANHLSLIHWLKMIEHNGLLQGVSGFNVYRRLLGLSNSNHVFAAQPCLPQRKSISVVCFHLILPNSCITECSLPLVPCCFWTQSLVETCRTVPFKQCMCLFKPACSLPTN